MGNLALLLRRVPLFVFPNASWQEQAKTDRQVLIVKLNILKAKNVYGFNSNNIIISAIIVHQEQQNFLPAVVARLK